MKVCQISTTGFDGHYYASLARGLAAAGAEQLFVSLRESQAPAWLREIPAANHLSLNAAGRVQYPSAVFRLASLLRREEIDILQTHLFEAGVLGLLAAQLAGTPRRFVARHHLDETWLLGTRWHVALDCWMARRADCVMVPSAAVREHMIANEALSGDNVEVIPYGFNFNSMAATVGDALRVRREFDLGNGFVLGCVGRFFKNKGHSYLFQAANKLKREIPNLRILLLGDGDRAMIEAMVTELGLQEQVVFAGHRKDVAACMKAMDILVHPSLSESFGQVLVEAMCVATPVIATTVGGVPEIIRHQETGLLAPPKDAEALTAAIRELHADPQRRAKLAIAGQRSVMEKFAVEKMVQHYVEVYQRHARASSDKGKSYVASQI